MTRLFFRFGKYATLFGNPIHSLTTFNHNVIIDYWWNSEWEKKQQQPAELNWLGIVNKISLFTQTFRCVTNSVKIETNLSALILSFFNVIDKDRHWTKWRKTTTLMFALQKYARQLNALKSSVPNWKFRYFLTESITQDRSDVKEGACCINRFNRLNPLNKIW